MEQKRQLDNVDSHKKLECYQLSYHNQTIVHKLMQEIESKWSDDESGINISKDDESDNTWLVANSISSTSSEHSIDSEDDENDLESIFNESESRSNTIHLDKFAKVWNNDIFSDDQIDSLQHQHQYPVSDHDININHLYNANNLDSSQQIDTQPISFLEKSKSRIHGYLSVYSEFITKTKHQEILLKLLQWSVWLVGACLISSSSSNGLLPHWFQKLSYDICYARYVTRLLGLPVALEGAMSGSWAMSCSVQKNASLEATYRFLGLILAYSMVVYYPVEHVAFFLWMNPNAETVWNLPAATWFYMSMRCWLVYLVAEMIQCIVKYNELQQHQRTVQQLKKMDINENNNSRDNHHHMNVKKKPSLVQQLQQFIVPRINISEETTKRYSDKEHHLYDTNKECDSMDYNVTPMELNDEMYNVQLLFIRNLFYFAPCMNWSMSTWDTDPLLSDMSLNGFMWMEAVICFYQAIYNATS